MEMPLIRTTTPGKGRAGTGRVKIIALADMWISTSEVIPGWAGMPLFKGATSNARRGETPMHQKRSDKLDDTTSGILEAQAIFDNDLESIQPHQEDYEAKLECISASRVTQRAG